MQYSKQIQHCWRKQKQYSQGYRNNNGIHRYCSFSANCFFKILQDNDMSLILLKCLTTFVIYFSHRIHRFPPMFVASVMH